jgi:hypothetical protein
MAAVPAPRQDTIVVSVPVIRLTTESANGSTPLDSASLELIERRVMSRLASMLRAEVRLAAGQQTAGIVPVKNGAPAIRHGLLGTITFNPDGSLAQSSRDRIAAIAELLNNIDAPLEIRARADLGTNQLDVALARARRVYAELMGTNASLNGRAIRISVSATPSLYPIEPQVEILYQQSEPRSPDPR